MPKTKFVIIKRTLGLSLTKPETKCSGETPCIHCVSSGTDCIYGQARRDRLREYAYFFKVIFLLLLMRSRAMDRNHALASLLRDMSERVSTEDRRRIKDALNDVSSDLCDPQ